MPFLAPCLFCGHQVRAPDHALGASACCPRCGNFFTLAPESRLKTTSPGRAPASSAATLVASNAGPSTSRGPTQAQSLRSARYGVAALLLAGAAMLAASIPPLCRLVIPLGLAGLVLGLVGLVLASSSPFHRLLPRAGTAVTSILLVTALFFPRLLGPAYRAYAVRVALNPEIIHVVPLPGIRGNAAVKDPEWVDASRAALQQNRVQVQVIAAAVVRPVNGRHLSIRLRIHEAKEPAQLASEAGRPSRHEVDKSRLRLTDERGQIYALRHFAVVAPVDDKRKSAPFPVVFRDAVLTFDPPEGKVKFFHLEVPTDAWGGHSSFRFTIPGPMIRFEEKP